MNKRTNAQSNNHNKHHSGHHPNQPPPKPTTTQTNHHPQTTTANSKKTSNKQEATNNNHRATHTKLPNCQTKQQQQQQLPEPRQRTGDDHQHQHVYILHVRILRSLWQHVLRGQVRGVSVSLEPSGFHLLLGQQHGSVCLEFGRRVRSVTILAQDDGRDKGQGTKDKQCNLRDYKLFHCARGVTVTLMNCFKEPAV